jgi:hypothetical protein
VQADGAHDALELDIADVDERHPPAARGIDDRPADEDRGISPPTASRTTASSANGIPVLRLTASNVSPVSVANRS